MTDETCAACKFSDMQNDRTALCKRHAPTVNPVAIHSFRDLAHGDEWVVGPRTFWPMVSLRDYCGDFIHHATPAEPTKDQSR